MKWKHLQGVVSEMIEDLLSFRDREAEGATAATAYLW